MQVLVVAAVAVVDTRFELVAELAEIELAAVGPVAIEAVGVAAAVDIVVAVPNWE